jgi:predicted TIM-barrel fold metal-dependent hydrolase
VPDWYRAIVLKPGANLTPLWNMSNYLSFMESQGITHAILAFSAPGVNVYTGNRAATIALARLINEHTAAYARAYPNKFTFYGVVPLPYTQHVLTEARYALETLDAAGIALYSNFEGHYLAISNYAVYMCKWRASRS